MVSFCPAVAYFVSAYCDVPARDGAAIREHALRLFSDQGFHVRTAEQIADAAEVSPSTFFRYYPAKGRRPDR
jgi:AcrR family transcriptional regulator